MKICIASGLYTPYNVGGGEISAQFLAEGLLEKGFDVIVLTIGERDEEDDVNGVRVVRIKPPNIYWGSLDAEKQTSFKKAIWHVNESYNYSLDKKLSSFFSKEKLDVLHVRNLIDISPYIWKVAKRHGAKVVNTVNNYASICVKVGMYKNGANCNDLCTICKVSAIPKRNLSNYVDAVVGVSEFTLNKHLENGFFKNAITRVVYTQTKLKKAKLPFKENQYLTFGFIGRLSETKGVINLIKSFNKLENNSKLVIAGKGEKTYVAACKSSAGEKIEFLGKVKPDIFYKKVDVVIINSLWHEPFPRVLMEAYSYGRPVISSLYGGTKELIEQGVTGFVYNPEIELLSDVIKKVEVLSNSRFKDMSSNCFKLIEQFKTSDIEQYVEIYKEILK